MNYWLDLFTGTTWQEFQDAGSHVSGFRERRWRGAARIQPGDVFLCYMVGVKRWVGLLKVTSERFRDESVIFKEERFPVRFRVKPLVILSPEHGVPMAELRGELSFYPADMSGSQWSGHVRGSPTRYSKEDGERIAAAIRGAKADPMERPVDKNQLKRPANLRKVKVVEGDKEIERVVSIPAADEDEETASSPGGPTHTEIQWRLLDLGSKMGLSVWAPRRDRAKAWNSKTAGDIRALQDELPSQFDANTNRIVEEIDVLWLDGQRIVAAFEVEHTTSIFSGLLRMSDLLTMQPNITIKLYIVGPDDRQGKFEGEVARPTFAARQRPLYSLCRFLPYSKLCSRLEEAKNVIRYLKPEFLDEIADLYNPEDEVDD